jgi:hypothetical protein
VHKCARKSIAHIHFALLRNIEHICVRLPSFTTRLCARSARACSSAREFHIFSPRRSSAVCRHCRTPRGREHLRGGRLQIKSWAIVL